MTTRTFRRLHELLNRAMLTIAHPDRPPALLRIDPAQAAAAVQADGPAIWTPAAPAEQPDREQLRALYTDAIRRWWDTDDGGAEEIADAVMAVRDTELEQARRRADLSDAVTAKTKQLLARRTETLRTRAERAEAARARDSKQHRARAHAINRVIALHQPRDHNGRTICGACSDYDPSSDSTDSTPVPHPCGTIHALDGTQQPTASPCACTHDRCPPDCPCHTGADRA